LGKRNRDEVVCPGGSRVASGYRNLARNGFMKIARYAALSAEKHGGWPVRKVVSGLRTIGTESCKHDDWTGKSYSNIGE
jgi:hypothetical protein